MDRHGGRVIFPTGLRLTRSTRNGPQQRPESQGLQRQSLTTSSTNSLPRASTGIIFACFMTLLGRRSETRDYKRNGTTTLFAALTHLISLLPAHIRSPGNWLACFTQAAS